MIPYDFEYHRPDTVDEAMKAYRRLDSQGKNPVYYSGGSEIISMARMHNMHTGAVIDLKSIPECNTLEIQGNQLIIGACVTLSRISESGLFPLLGKSAGRIADHTMQCRITIGGNVSGTIIYREMILPLLLSDCSVIAAVGGRLLQTPVGRIFNERLQLEKGGFIIRFVIKKEYAEMPYVHVKKTKNEKIDYPLVSVAALKKDGKIRLAMSGVCSFPFRSSQVEDDLNDRSSPLETRARNTLEHLPAPVLNDISGSDAYRRFVLKNTLIDTMETFEHVH